MQKKFGILGICNTYDLYSTFGFYRSQITKNQIITIYICEKIQIQNINDILAAISILPALKLIENSTANPEEYPEEPQEEPQEVNIEVVTEKGIIYVSPIKLHVKPVEPEWSSGFREQLLCARTCFR